MKPLQTLSLLLFSAFLLPTSLSAQCSEYIAEKTTTEPRYIRTHPQLLVSRERYQYTVEFVADGQRIMGILRSINGASLNQGDEVIFVDTTGTRQYYPLVTEELTKTVDGAVIHENAIELDQTDLTWLTGTNISLMYIKNNSLSEIRKYTIQVEQQAALYRTAKCFMDVVDRSVD